MAKLPNPRLPLPEVRPDEVTTLLEGTRIWRVYRTEGAHPGSWSTFRTYGPVANGRFDHHDPPPHEDQDRGIHYGALDATAALAEAFQDSRVIDRFRDGPWLACYEIDLDLALLDLGGSWPTRSGASQAIASGRRDRAQAWSREIHAAYESVQGLLYPSSMAGGSSNVALYERAVESLPNQPSLHLPLAHPGLLLPINRVANQFGYGLV